MFVAVSALGMGPSAATPADPTVCGSVPPPTAVIEQPPWTQPVYAAPEKLWPFSTGEGVTVAVVDTGVDSSHMQLTGKVLPGFDFVRNVPDGTVDCAAQGTAIASIVAGERLSGIGFYGLAPDATILPVRITEKVQAGQASDATLTAAQIGAGITFALSQGASVIVVPEVVYVDAPELDAAVASAIASGAVIVASVGDAHPSDKKLSGQPTPFALTPYPAAIDGVVGVGAVGQDGQRASSSQVGSYVDLVAPGVDIVAAGVAGHQEYKGTAYASAYVAASAALLQGQSPSILGNVSGSERSALIAQRLMGTASPIDGHMDKMAYGAGLVDPYRAMTETLTSGAPLDGQAYAAPPFDPEAVAHERFEATATTRSSAVLWVVIAALVLTGLVVLTVRLGRKNDWRTREVIERVGPVRDRDLEYVSGDKLFAPPPMP